MDLVLKDGLLFINLTLGYKESATEVSNVLIDTGSSSTIMASDIVETIGIVPEPHDVPFLIVGVGGSEVVYKRRVEFVEAGNVRLHDFDIEVGGMDYGFDINGILGMDFLIAAGSIIDLSEMKIHFKQDLL
jgi:predicted aspartyl protease